VKSIWQDGARRELADRLGAVTPDRRAEWGTLSAPKMVCHLADSLNMAMGDLEVATKWLPIRYTPLKQLIIYAAPFPKGAQTAPELLKREPREWANDVADVQDLLARAASARTTAAWPDHPLFGKLSKRAWGVLIYRHMDHHLRQFGA
jgi:hypothetical protein